MKVWILGLLLFLSIPARSQESMCGSLFSEYPYPRSLPIERDLFYEAKGVFKLVKAEEINGYLRIQKPIVDFLFADSKPSKADLSSEQIRLKESLIAMHLMYSLKNYIKNKELPKSTINNLELRMVGTLIGVTLRIAEVLSSKGINHTINYNNGKPFIIIRTDGKHFLNKIEKRLKAKSRLEIVFDVFQLIDSHAGALFINQLNSPKIILDPNILLEDSIIQNTSALHEYTHHLDAIMDRKKQKRPYHGGAFRKEPNPKAKTYGNSFSIDEIQAYRTSIRTFAHEALFSKADNDFDHWYDQIKIAVRFELIFSSIIKLSLQDKNSAFVVEGKVEEEKILEMANFTYDMYRLIDQKIKETEPQSMEEKKTLLKKIISLITRHEVKELNGNYPTTAFMKSILNQ